MSEQNKNIVTDNDSIVIPEFNTVDDARAAFLASEIFNRKY